MLNNIYANYIKRLLDIAVSLLILILISPIFLIVFVCYLIKNENPFFVQERPGKNSRIFKIIKFKTMNNKLDEKGELLSPMERITPMGALMRKFSIDELPQLINILKGDMSLIGPRPLLPEYLKLYNNTQRRRHEVRPGITGLAQVNGRNAISWEEKFNFDIYYVDNISFAMDLKILYLTIIKVLKADNINAGKVTMEKFQGSN
jgi:undecaprenyl phosphate N,N'-diacetylbacillosamine 1-phosphate transferase